jgi:glycosyltransferase involved in cell wall biosynthesis
MVATFYPPYNFGGDGIGIQRLCHGLVRRGHHVTVVHDADAYLTLARRQEPAPVEHPPGLEVVSLRSRLGAVSTLLTHQTGRPVVHRGRLFGLLAQGRFDVINYHNISLVGGPGVLRYGDALKLYMAHEHWLVCPSHVLWRHNRERCDRRECLRCVLRYRRPPQLWRYTGLLERELGHVDAFIAMSEFSRQKHREFGFARDMEVVPYFLPDSGPVRDQLEVDGASPHPRPYFLSVGRLEVIKGLDDVIPVFRHYQDADLLIVGDGEYAGALRAKAADLPNVRFLGRIAPDALRPYYQHALALIASSVCFETFGIVLIEAFREGTPVLGRRLGPFPEILEKAGAGLLFANEHELLDGMKTIQRDPALRREWRERAMRAFARHWSESAVIPRYLDVVRRAAERTGRQRIVEALSESTAVAAPDRVGLDAGASDDTIRAAVDLLPGRPETP